MLKIISHAATSPVILGFATIIVIVSLLGIVGGITALIAHIKNKCAESE
jgi:hypothetical protein